MEPPRIPTVAEVVEYQLTSKFEAARKILVRPVCALVLTSHAVHHKTEQVL